MSCQQGALPNTPAATGKPLTIIQCFLELNLRSYLDLYKDELLGWHTLDIDEALKPAVKRPKGENFGKVDVIVTLGAVSVSQTRTLSTAYYPWIMDAKKTG